MFKWYISGVQGYYFEYKAHRNFTKSLSEYLAQLLPQYTIVQYTSNKELLATFLRKAVRIQTTESPLFIWKSSLESIVKSEKTKKEKRSIGFQDKMLYLEEQRRYEMCRSCTDNIFNVKKVIDKKRLPLALVYIPFTLIW